MPSRIHGAKNGWTMNIKSIAVRHEKKNELIKLVESIGRRVKAGENIMVFWQWVAECESWPSMNQVMAKICEVSGINQKEDTVMMWGSMDGKNRTKVYGDVRTGWLKRVVITNSCVTAGVNFDVEGPDRGDGKKGHFHN